MRDIVWLLFLSAALFTSLFYHLFTVSLAAAAGLVLAASASLWHRFGLRAVTFRSALDRTRVSFGETIELRTDVSNAKLLPLAWLKIEQRIPSRVSVRGATVHPGPGEGEGTMMNAMGLLPYERVVRRFAVLCGHRGRFDFHPARLESGDPFGLGRVEGSDGETTTLTVYPKLRTLLNLPVSAEGLIGERRVRRWFPHDPLAVVGARAYRGGDPAAAIDWRVTARMRTLHVRELESTASPQLAIFLHMATRGGGSSAVECAISFAASLVLESVERGWAVGICAAPAVGESGRVMLPMGRGARQVGEALESLAALVPGGDANFADVLEIETRRLPFGATPCAVVVDPGDDDVLALAVLSERRSTIVFVLDVDGSAARLEAALPRANVIRVPFEADWTERDAVTVGV